MINYYIFKYLDRDLIFAVFLDLLYNFGSEFAYWKFDNFSFKETGVLV